MFEETAHIKV